MAALNPVIGNMDDRKTQRVRKRKLLTEMLLDYTKNSTLHGLRYTTERRLTAVEKIFWILTFLASVACCFLLMRNVWVKWQTSPVIVTFSEKMLPVSEVPFPSVTVCPQLKIDSRRYNYSEAFEKYNQHIQWTCKSNLNISDIDMPAVEKFEDAFSICNQSFKCITNRTRSDASLFQHIDEMSLPFDDIFSYYCQWKSEIYLCSEMFKKVITRDGICYNFNSLPLKKILNENSVRNNYLYLTLLPRHKPWTILGVTRIWRYNQNISRRGREVGARPDIHLRLKKSVNGDKLCKTHYVDQFKVYIQHPSDLAQTSRIYVAVEPGKKISVALKVKVLDTSESLQKYSPKIRQCYFPGEKYLRYFKTYSFSNCQLECLSNLTYQKCGCVWFHMPHNNTNEICTQSQSYCFDTVEDSLSTSKACDCLEPCESVKYEAEISQTNIEPESKFFDYFEIEMYFKDPQFVSMRRSELFGVTDFLANCGGLLGLFLGFSFLSLVEFFYFCTLKLCCMWQKTTSQGKDYPSELSLNDTRYMAMDHNIIGLHKVSDSLRTRLPPIKNTTAIFSIQHENTKME